MDILDLKNNADLIGCEEYLLTKDHKIGQFSFITKAFNSREFDKYFQIESQLYVDDEGSKYYIEVKTHSKLRDKGIECNYENNKIYRKLSDFIDFIEYKFDNENSNDIVLNTLIHRYENATEKTDDSFTFVIETTNHKFNINVPKHCKVTENRSVYTVTNINTNITLIQYTVCEDSILSYSKDEFGKPHLSLIDIRDDNSYMIIDIDDFDDNFDQVFAEIPNMSLRANNISFSEVEESVDFEYNYLQTDSTKHDTLCIGYTGAIDGTKCIVSVHPVYYDMFDYTMNLNRDYLWCTDQLEFVEDEIYYTRAFYKLDEKYNNELLEFIKSNEDINDTDLITSYDDCKEVILEAIK